MFQEVDFWRHPIKVGGSVDIHVTADQLEEIDASLAANGMTYQVKLGNIQP